MPEGWRIHPHCIVFWGLACAALLQPVWAQPAPVQSARDFAGLVTAASAARDANRLDEAAALYRQALGLRPEWAEGWWSLGTLAYDANAYADAVAAFEKLAALDARAGSARVMLGLCEFELGQDDRALEHIQAGERIGVAKDAQLRNVALYHEGVLLQRAGKFESAQQALASLCLAGVHSPELASVLGMVALRMRDRNPPQNTEASDVVRRVGEAERLAGQKKFDEARAQFVAVAGDYPHFLNIHYAFGRFLLDARDSPAGLAELQREIKEHPDHALARLEIAAAKYKIDSAGGVPYAEAAVKLDPQLAFGHYLLGLLLLDTDEYRRAIPELETAKKSLKQVPGVFSALGAAYARAGRDDDAAEARAAFQRLNRESATSAAPQP